VPDIPPPLIAAASGRWTPESPACAVTVGNFDGVHLGHAAIVRQVCAAARRLDVPSVAFTFDPHPAALVRPGAAPAPLSTPARRAALLRSLGIDAVVVQPTDRALVSLPAEAFYADILRGRLHASAIVEGTDFHFGANRSGDIHLLETLCGRDGVTLETVPAVVADGLPVSSSRLRGLISTGAVREAALLLTSPYRLTGTVVQGARRGATIGFPTANLSDIATLLPAAGVYAARVTLPDGSTHPAAVHIGPNISFGETRISVEAHLIGFSGTLYGSTLDVDFLDRLRDTQKFDSIDALKAQLTADVARALEVVSSIPDESRIIV
jgi:riboflavin kinase/FMN adenylyltransferase